VAVVEAGVEAKAVVEVEVEVEGVNGVVGRSDTEAVKAAVVGEVGVKGSDSAGAAATTDGKAVLGKALSVKEDSVRSTDGKTNDAASWEWEFLIFKKSGASEAERDFDDLTVAVTGGGFCILRAAFLGIKGGWRVKERALVGDAACRATLSLNK
jgi:hypothetical protein